MQQLWTERAYWQNLGITREALAERPWREVADYTLIFQLEGAEQQAQANRQQARGA